MYISYYIFNPPPVTRHPSPATPHPPPATRHPPPVTRHPSPATRHPRKSPAVFKTVRSICFTFFEMNLYVQEIIIGLLWSLSNCYGGTDKNFDFSPFYKLGVSYAIQQTFPSDLNWPLKKITRLHMKKKFKGSGNEIKNWPLVIFWIYSLAIFFNRQLNVCWIAYETSSL